MLRKGYVFLLVVFLCKTLTGISCNSSDNVPAGEPKQIFPMVWIFFFSFLSLLFIFSLSYRDCSAEEQRTPSHPVCLPPVSDTPHCCPMQGLPASLGTTGSVGPPPPYLLQETARGSMHSVCCPLTARHRVLEEEKGIGSCLWCWKHCRSIAVCSYGI